MNKENKIKKLPSNIQLNNKLTKKNLTMLMIPIIMLLMLVTGATYAYYSVQVGNTSSTKSIVTSVPKVGNASLVNMKENLHVRMNALNMQEENALTELWATDTNEDYETEETPRLVARASIIGGEEDARYSCTFNVNISLSGTMVNLLQANDALIRFSGLDNFEYDLTNITTPKTVTINTLGGENREEDLYVTVKVNNNDYSQDYLQGTSLEIDITTTDFNCTIKSAPSNHIYAVNFHPNRLPSAYQEVDYIKGKGNQYIITDVVPTNESGVYLEMVNNDSNSNLVYFGSGYYYNNSNTSNGFWIGNQSNRFYARWDILYSKIQQNVLLDDTAMTNNKKYIFELNYLNDRKVKRDNDVYVDNLSSLSTKTLPISIFGYNNDTGNGNDVKLPAKYQLYSFKISSGNRVIRNFISCYRISDGKVGLYETMNNVFYTNDSNSSVDFEKGNDVYYDQLISVNVNTSLYKNTYIKDGYQFVKWNTEKDGSGTNYNNGENVLNLTSENNTIDLYAMWSSN